MTITFVYGCDDCMANVDWVKTGQLSRIKMLYCPRHAAAPAMLEFIKWYVETLSDEDCNCEYCAKSRELVALADGDRE